MTIRMGQRQGIFKADNTKTAKQNIFKQSKHYIHFYRRQRSGKS
jgi:hypothetical protein